MLVVFSLTIKAQTNTFPASGNVGIGITNPQATLNVNGSLQLGLNTDTYYSHLNANILTFNRAGTSYIDFKNDSNSLSFRQGSSYNTVMYLSSYGSVGIGNASPAQKLHLSGHMLLDNSKELRWLDSGGTQRTVLKLDSNNNLNLGTSAGGSLVFYNGSSYTERMRIIANGNIGIGTTAPSAKLEVKSANNTAGLVLGNENFIGFKRNDGALVYGVGHTNNEFTIGRTAALGANAGTPINIATGGSYTKFSHAGNEMMRINSNGNVGIGTTNPSNKFTVNGFIKAEGSDGRLMLENPSVNTAIYLRNRGDFGQRKLEVLYGPTVKMVMNNNGDLGLGTTNPSSKLHVEGEIKIKSSSNIPLQLYSPDTYSGILFSDIHGTSRIFYRGATGTYDIGGSGYNVTNKKLHIHGGTSIGTGFGGASVPINGLTVEGNVGIGKYNPEYQLDVSNTARVLTDSDAIAIFKSTDNKAWINVADDDTSGFFSAENGHISIGPYAGVNAQNFNIDVNTNNVGIGTVSPSEKLEVAGNFKIGYQNKITSGSTSTFKSEIVPFTINGNTEFRNYYATGDYDFYTGNGVHGNNELAFKIQSNGNVGIGTSDPKNKLTVKGVINSEGDGDFYGAWFGGEKRTENPSINMGVWHNNKGSIYWDSNERRLVFSTQNNDSSIFDNTMSLEDGKVGIGIASVPSDYKLAVAGKIITEEIKVKLQSSGWPDYVFAKDYDLMSVEEVETYIKKNGHLPKMPSAKEVEKEGVLLGEMNKKLLEKIEELTLYTIAQEKKIQQQNKKIKKLESLEKRMERLEAILKNKEK